MHASMAVRMKSGDFWQTTSNHMVMSGLRRTCQAMRSTKQCCVALFSASVTEMRTNSWRGSGVACTDNGNCCVACVSRFESMSSICVALPGIGSAGLLQLRKLCRHRRVAPSQLLDGHILGFVVRQSKVPVRAQQGIHALKECFVRSDVGRVTRYKDEAGVLSVKLIELQCYKALMLCSITLHSLECNRNLSPIESYSCQFLNWIAFSVWKCILI